MPRIVLAHPKGEGGEKNPMLAAEQERYRQMAAQTASIAPSAKPKANIKKKKTTGEEQREYEEGLGTACCMTFHVIFFYCNVCVTHEPPLQGVKSDSAFKKCGLILCK